MSDKHTTATSASSDDEAKGNEDLWNQEPAENRSEEAPSLPDEFGTNCDTTEQQRYIRKDD